MNYFIVEDQMDARELIQKYLVEDFPQLTMVGYADRYVYAMEQIPRLKPDLLLLDINLGGHDAFELLDVLQQKMNGKLGLIIFISAYVDSDHILKAFEYFPLRYITKPIDRKKLQISIDQAIHQFNLGTGNEQNRIALRPFQISKLRIPKIRGEVELVELEHILFLQSFHEGQVTKLFLVNNPMPISASKHLGYFKELLADYKQFFAISQSILVNLNYLKSYTNHNKTLFLHQWSEPLVASRRGGEDLKRWLCGE
ncbi:MAG: response regulator [Saprospiraceae bacterium]|nr:response regulator [Saprospiraceae bacterium]